MSFQSGRGLRGGGGGPSVRSSPPQEERRGGGGAPRLGLPGGRGSLGRHWAVAWASSEEVLRAVRAGRGAAVTQAGRRLWGGERPRAEREGSAAPGREEALHEAGKEEQGEARRPS